MAPAEQSMGTRVTAYLCIPLHLTVISNTKENAMYTNEISIGGVRIPNRLVLGPMAGVTDRPFRTICHELGAGLVMSIPSRCSCSGRTPTRWCSRQRLSMLFRMTSSM